MTAGADVALSTAGEAVGVAIADAAGDDEAGARVGSARAVGIGEAVDGALTPRGFAEAPPRRNMSEPRAIPTTSPTTINRS